jgi:hypothetical protein
MGMGNSRKSLILQGEVTPLIMEIKMNKWDFENLKDDIARLNEVRLDQLTEFIEQCQINLNHSKKFKVGDHVRVGTLTRGTVQEINHGKITIITNRTEAHLQTRTHSARFFEHL